MPLTFEKASSIGLEQFSQRLQRQAVSTVEVKTENVFFGDGIEGVAGSFQQYFSTTSPGFSKDALQLGEGFFYVIEVRGVWWQEE
jgi:hypothetical protein